MGADTDESRHKHREWAQTIQAEWTQTYLIWQRHRLQKDRGQKDTERQKCIEWAERHSWTKMQFTQTTKLDTKTITDVYKVEGTKVWVGSKWLTKRERESHKQGYRVGTNTDKSRFKHIESGHKQHKQGHKRSFTWKLTMVFIDIILFVEFTVSLEASNQSTYDFTFLQSTCDVTFLQSFQSGIIRWTLVRHTLSAFEVLISRLLWTDYCFPKKTNKTWLAKVI